MPFHRHGVNRVVFLKTKGAVIKLGCNIRHDFNIEESEQDTLCLEKELERFFTLHLVLQPSSIRLVLGRWSIFQKWLDNKVLCGDTIDDFLMDLKSKGKSNSALNSYIFAFRMIGKYLEHKEKENPFTKVKSLPKVETVINPLTTEEIMKLITCEVPYGLFHGKDLTKEANALYTSMLVFLSFTGARYDEMASLKVQEVDIENRVATFYHTKNQKPHRIKIPPMVMKYLVPHTYLKTPKSFLFESVSHGKVCSQNFSFNVRKRAKLCGITKPVNPHNFRHSYGTEMRRGGMKIEDIARLLNHKDIQTTFKYYDHVQAEELEKETIRHPLIRDSAKPEDIFKLVKEAIQSFNLDHDARFEASYSDTELVVRLRP